MQLHVHFESQPPKTILFKSRPNFETYLALAGAFILVTTVGGKSVVGQKNTSTGTICILVHRHYLIVTTDYVTGAKIYISTALDGHKVDYPMQSATTRDRLLRVTTSMDCPV